MNWSKNSSIELSRICVVLFMILLAALDIGCYWAVQWFVEIRLMYWQYGVLMMVTIYLCSGFGWVLLVAGQEGKRSALKHSRVMIHQPLGGVQGQASDIEIEAREIQKFKKELYTIISEHSHTPFDKVWADSDRNYWMTAEEAKEYGMIDQVMIRKK